MTALPRPRGAAPAFSADGRLWRGLRVVARGANRVCVLDPDLPGHCLKYALPPDPAARKPVRRRLRALLARLAPWRQGNRLEWRAWRRLHARLGDGMDARVARCLGPVRTPAGPALRCALVTDATGAPAPSLYACLSGAAAGRAGYDADALCAAVSRFEDWLHAEGIPLFDLNSGNLVAVDGPDGPELVCVDVKSVLENKEIVPFSRWSRRLMHRKIARRAERLRQRIRAHAPLAGAPSGH